MARVTIEDCLKRVPNRFLLANMVARRVRQIRDGGDFLLQDHDNEDIVMALREIAAGKVRLASENRKDEMEDSEYGAFSGLV
ncbi:MAG: DNA-directed RNA polymerase subunit omega [Thermodesulfobacteriota bacterium]